MNKILNYLKITLEILFVIIFIFFEELIWKKFALPIKKYIASLKILEGTQKRIEKQSPYTTLAIFILPLGLAELMGIYSGIMFISGHLVIGIAMYALKIPIAGLTFWIFSFSKEKLLSIDWFETLYGLLIRFISFVKKTKIYRRVIIRIKKIKIKIKKRFSSDNSFKKHIKNVYLNIKKTFNTNTP